MKPITDPTAVSSGYLRQALRWFVCFLTLDGSFVLSSDWPAYRGDMARTGYVDEIIDTNLELLWIHTSSAPPNPAWPKPARRSYWQRLESIEPRMTDDVTFHPVVYDNHVFWGSSSEDTVYCVDAESGAVAWRFFTDGPVRYAPVLDNGRIFFGCDDGHVYCLDARSGVLIWKRRLAHEDRRLPGNGRIISAWPVRTGLVYRRGKVFATAGIYPQQGAYAYAIDATDGSTDWEVLLDDSPQGYLLASSQQITIPTGRSNPIVVDLETGQFLKRLEGVGGTFAVASDGLLIAGKGNDGSLVASDSISGERMVQFKGSQLAVTPNYSYLFETPFLTVLDRKNHFELTKQIKTLTDQSSRLKQSLLSASDPESESIKATLIQLGDLLNQANRSLSDCVKARVELNSCTGLIASDQTVVVGVEGGVEFYRGIDGRKIKSLKMDGKALGMAYSNESLFVSNEMGQIYCFGRRDVDDSSSDPVVSSNTNDSLTRKETSGYALVIGASSVDSILTLWKEHHYKVIVIEPDSTLVEALRLELYGRGLYGHAIAVHQMDKESLPFTDYFANLILVDPKCTLKCSEMELKRLLRPHGGTLHILGKGEVFRRGGLDGEGSWTHLYGNPQNSSHSGDQRVGSPMTLQWFGGPGPEKMVDRHLRGAAPLYHSGTLVVPGENIVMGVDAYNGSLLWEHSLPVSQRYSMPFDAGYMSMDQERIAIAANDVCLILDSQTGNLKETFQIPGKTSGKHWGYTALVGGKLLGSIQKTTASRTEPGYQQIDADYRNAQPIVTSEKVFCLDLATRSISWESQGTALLNPTITVDMDRLFFVENRDPVLQSHPTGRIPLNDFLNASARVTAISLDKGELLWSRALPDSLLPCRNILYLSYGQGRLVACGSYLNENADTTYEIVCLDGTTGETVWSDSQLKGKPGQTFHGEQVHHPVMMGRFLIAEPRMYELETGELVAMPGEGKDWILNRPGHSCGTLSAGGDCLFFRATNPTVLDLKKQLASGEGPVKLSPSRTGCWINIIPAGGLILIPEASAGCVCHFSLQTSMAFLPRPE